MDSVAVVGAGSIGIAWAIVFACAGRRVQMQEVDPARREIALGEAKSKLHELEAGGLLREPIATVLSRISVSGSLEEAVAGVGYVQECIIENLEAKQELFARLDALTPRDVVLASSTSTIMASRFASDLAGRDRCIVVHPANPPYFLRVAEIVPAPFTSESTVSTTSELLASSGLAPILLKQEIEGFVFNRLQGALLREAYCLVRDEIVTPVELDTLVREGLGLRWSLIGPFTTSELNTRGGLRRHGEVLGPVYARIGIERAQEDPWTPETIEQVARAVENSLPHRSWEDNVRERDRGMIQLSSLLKHFENPLTYHRTD
ncbi:3-hydroxyacyl-CoA dehydrogenase [Leucobacter soli]|uniref:3-hydroxyacyl-CoA dehydrogenase n=1 Tax=Leucobacter soli TaxID=2812850 RepID=UPI00360DC024